MKDSWFEHSGGRKVYECADCLGHHTSSDRLETCPECGGPVENLSKARAE